jgi:DNA polymerase
MLERARCQFEALQFTVRCRQFSLYIMYSVDRGRLPSLTITKLCWRIVRVSKEMKESLAEIALQLQEQLKFYRELGFTEIGGSAVAAESAPVARFQTAADESVTNAASVHAFVQAKGDSQIVKDEKPQVSAAEPAVSASEKIAKSAEANAFAAPVAEAHAATKQRPNGEAAPDKAATSQMTSLFGDSLIASGGQISRHSLPILSALPKDASLAEIRADIGDCQRCKLHQQRTKIVFGEGNPQAQLMFVGEGPGADEDLSGRPFVGRAGQLLDKIIAAIGRKREEVYIANVVKCRPPQNRTPESDEVATCEPFLFRQIALIQPAVIVALGSPAFQCLFRTKESISRARGELRDWNDIKVMPTFHPAYLLRSPDKKREVWEDMKIVRDYLNSLSK